MSDNDLARAPNKPADFGQITWPLRLHVFIWTAQGARDLISKVLPVLIRKKGVGRGGGEETEEEQAL